MTELELAKELARAWTPIAPASLQGACIESTKYGIEVLRRVGVKAKPLPCALAAFNQAGWRAFQAHLPFRDWPEEAWSIGVDPDRRTPDPEPGRRGWDGHLIIEGDTFLADLALGDLARPHRQLYLEPLAVAKGGEAAHLEGGWAAVSDQGTVVVWQERRELRRWKQGSAWRRPPDEELVETLVAFLSAPDQGRGR